MMPKINTIPIILPSSRSDRRRTDTFGGGQLHAPSKDEVSLGDDEFGVPEDLSEQVRFKRQLMAMAKCLKKEQHQLKTDHDFLTDRWTKVLATEEYGLDRPANGHKKHNSLPQPEKEVLKPTPRRQYITVRGNTQET